MDHKREHEGMAGCSMGCVRGGVGKDRGGKRVKRGRDEGTVNVYVIGKEQIYLIKKKRIS